MIFMCLLAPFNVQNFKKSLEWIRSSKNALEFRVQNGPFTPTRYFFEKPLSFMYLLGLFIVINFLKKS